ncbi:cohesin domain-containing protein [Undibacterium terreum]|uniref:General secretion pathway protein D n=1 Tax=Undibacterium terreum TaxID=1224302 RepID=A0A916UQG9_9BURK|nr:cohesin domain-containing protein [Undibacterium terreum]GGC83313.1 hypothetical protein GCM10011396_33400 [Undibacterium terreum]
MPHDPTQTPVSSNTETSNKLKTSKPADTWTNFDEELKGKLSKKIVVWTTGCLGILLLTACAGQMAYRNGKELVADGKVEQGLAKFQEAITYAPQDAQFRSAYLQTRERALNSYLEQADKLANGGQRTDAEKLYQRALSIAPGNERAKAGLLALDVGQRHTKALQEASAAFNKKDVETARARLAGILAENPENEQALALQRAINERTMRPASESLLAANYKKPITIEFRDVALKQIFDVISRSSGLNFLFDKEVKTDQRTSIFLKNSTIESAVHFTLLTNQLEQQVLDGNTILIYPNTAAKQKDYQEMVVRTFFLTNADAKNVANTIKTIVKSRDIVVDEKLNMLIVRDSPDAIKIAEKLIALQDVAEPEVMLEVEILEVKRTRLQDLGIQWPGSLSLTPLSLSGVSGTGTTSSNLTLNDLLHQNQRSIGASVGTTTIRANVQDSDANLLANPRIRARNHEKAKILIGERVPNITSTATSTGFVSQSINYIDIGLTLNVEPTVYLDDDVAIKVSLEVSSIINQITTQSGTSAYEIGTRTASTVLRLKNGETEVLAGLINDQERRSGNKIPGIGEVPVVGRLFGNTNNNDEKTEIVLSITPHLIRNIQRPDATQASFRSGTENSLRVRQDSTITNPVTTAPTVTNPSGTQQNRQAPAAPATGANDASMGSGSLGSASGSSNANPVIVAPDLQGGISGGGIPSASGAKPVLQGPPQAKVGDTISLQVVMQSDQPIANLPLTLRYDNKVLQVTGISEGDFMKQGGVQTRFTSGVDTNGNILITDTRADNSGVASPATLVTVNFRTLAEMPATQVQLISMTATGPVGNQINAVLPAAYSVQVIR